MPSTPVPKPKRVSDTEVLALVANFEESKKVAGAATKEAQSIQKIVVANLEYRKVKSITFRDGTTVTKVQNSSLVYDEKGIWSDLTPRQRRSCFEDQIDLNALSSETRRAIIATLTREERTAVTTRRLDVSKLSQAVQDGKIPAEVVAKNADENRSAAFIRVSHGSGS